jgi:hypothetical protein
MQNADTAQPRTRRAAQTAAAVCVASVGLTGCFNAIDVTDAGRMGVTVDAKGDPVLLVMLCESSRPYVQLTEGRKPSDADSKQSTQRGEWSADTKVKGVQRLTLGRPEAMWTTKQSPGALAPGVLLIAEGGTAEDDTATFVPVDFRPTDLVALRPGQVLTAEKTIPLAAFGRYTCRN